VSRITHFGHGAPPFTSSGVPVSHLVYLKLGALKRRDLILGSAASAWSFATHAQQSERVRRIGVIVPAASSDTEFQTWLGAFLLALAQLGWTIGRNMRADIRWATPVAVMLQHPPAQASLRRFRPLLADQKLLPDQKPAGLAPQIDFLPKYSQAAKKYCD
jgi:hypothetical protein